MIPYVKIRDVKDPCRANAHDAGTDFFLPKMDFTMIEAIKKKNPHVRRWSEIIQFTPDQLHIPDEEKTYYLRLIPGVRVTIPSGIKTWILEKDSALIAFNKSGLASNKGIVVTAQVVDADYTGEIHVGLLNTSEDVVYFNQGDKIGQFLHLDVHLDDWKQISAEEYQELSSSSDRGEGGFGSSDKNR